MRLAERVKGEEEGEGQGKAAEDQHVFLPRGHAIDPDAEVEVFLKSTGFFAGADVTKCRFTTAAHRTAEPSGVQIFKGRSGLDPNLLHPFIWVIDISTAAALEAVGAWIALWSGLYGKFYPISNWRLFRGRQLFRCLFGRLKLVAHRIVAVRDDSIRVNSWQ